MGEISSSLCHTKRISDDEEKRKAIKNLKLMKKPKSLVFFIINSKFIFLFLDRREIIFIEPYTLIVKIKMVSNLWLTVLLVVTIFLGLCVGESFSFFTTPTTMSNNPHVTRRATTAAATALLVPSWSSLSSLASTVIDSPTITEDDIIIEILKDSETKSQEKNGKDGWEIRLFNDPMNHRTFVAKCLNEICGKSDSESYQIMMQAHKSGYVKSSQFFVFFFFFFFFFFFLSRRWGVN
jgi:hypothetical protein